jgi:hypothetical protein
VPFCTVTDRLSGGKSIETLSVIIHSFAAIYSPGPANNPWRRTDARTMAREPSPCISASGVPVFPEELGNS